MPSQIEYPLPPDIPEEWSPTFGYAVELRYRLDANGQMEFSYHDSPFEPWGFESLSLLTTNFSDTPETSWSPYYPLAEFNEALDLKVVSDCLIILRTADGSPIYWSLAHDAITLKKKEHQIYYFALNYIHYGEPYDRTVFPEGQMCKQVSFGALYNRDNPDDDQHPFNFHIVAENADRILVEVPIDPDIRNPGGLDFRTFLSARKLASDLATTDHP